MSDDDLTTSRSSSIGLDSLISVNIRSWFLKNLQVSTPILKIIGNNTMESLVRYVIDIMPAEVTPHIGVSGDEEPRESAICSSTVGELSTLVSGTDSRTSTASEPEDSVVKRGWKHNGIEPIDWEVESTPSASWVSIPLDVSSSPPSTPANIIELTGVTSLLGRHLLEHLSSTHPQRQYTVLQYYYPGNLCDSFLGLRARGLYYLQFNRRRHPERRRHFLRQALPKLAGLQRLVHHGPGPSLSPAPHACALHFGGGIYYNQAVFPEVSVTGPGSRFSPADGAFGYGFSKWVSEGLLGQVHVQSGLPVWICRPSTILREGADAVTMRAQLDYVNALLYYLRKLKAAPEVEHNRGALDLVLVESCCCDVLRYIADDSDSARMGLKYVNQVGDIVIPFKGIRDMDSDVGKRYDVLPLREWTNRAMAAGLHPGVALLIEEMDAPGKPDYPKLLKGKAG
ncbi:hypothetical protein F5B20DRAFT_591678 [Whalleya microplaca]|nr:hypothetical protein F5B20DRAFT_591678 [Whalleya microplaca]